MLVQRGGCSYLQKAQMVQAGNASAMVAYDPAGARGCLRMGTNASEAVLAELEIVSVSVSGPDGLALAAAADEDGSVSVWMPR